MGVGGSATVSPGASERPGAGAAPVWGKQLVLVLEEQVALDASQGPAEPEEREKARAESNLRAHDS